MSEWQAIARTLRIGQSRKITCCGSGPSTYVSNSPSGIRIGPCFRCGYKEYEPHKERSAAEIMASRRLPPPTKTASVPSRAVPLSDPSVPSYARLFMLKAGFTPEESYDEHSIVYDPEKDRVLVPIPDGYLSRRVASWDKGPKWIRYGGSNTTCVLYGRGGDTVVAVEDCLSGLKIAKAGYTALVILGTSLSDGAATRLADYKQVLVWTDGDAAGDKAHRHIRKRLGAFDKTVSRIRTDEDPKSIPLHEIRRTLDA
tara:strand:+ start:234 stop:1001 length:768 start_codon:yes stop_codon:yes gene_type:complete